LKTFSRCVGEERQAEGDEAMCMCEGEGGGHKGRENDLQQEEEEVVVGFLQGRSGARFGTESDRGKQKGSHVVVASRQAGRSIGGIEHEGRE
jgi:hypothetical protein